MPERLAVTGKAAADQVLEDGPALLVVRGGAVGFAEAAALIRRNRKSVRHVWR
jgi:hypothetical protein